MAADFYQVLEIPDTANEKEIKRAYRRKALKTHPDVNSAPDAKAQFDEVVKAYEVLSDEKQKQKYDRKRNFSSPFGRGRASGGSRAGSDGSSWGRAAYDPAREEASRRWREQNPKPDEIDDSFGDIFRDFIGGVATVGAGGVLNDVVDFLENRVDSFSSDTSVEFEDLMSSDNLEEAVAELENTRLLLEQLQKRIRKLDTDRATSEKEVAASRAAVKRVRDIDELDRQMALIEKAAGLKARLEETQGHVKRAKSRLSRLERKVADLKSRGGSRSYTSSDSSTYGSKYSTSSSSSSSSSPRQPNSSAGERSRRSEEQQRAGGSSSNRRGSSSKKPPPSASRGPGGRRRTDDPDVEAELARLKREMGL